MKFGERAFSLISLAFGLIAAGALALAVATDFWIHAIEPIRVDNETTIIGSFDVAPPAAGDQSSYIQAKPEGNTNVHETQKEIRKENIFQQGVYVNNENGVFHVHRREFDNEEEEPGDPEIGFLPDTTDHNVPITFNMHSHSGLWRICIIYEEPDLPPESCSTIGYFSQTSERVEKGDTTNSINRAIRKSAPVIVGSLFVLLVALSMSILGTTKNDYRTIVSAVIYIFSALALAMGIVMYISAVNDEVSHRKKTVDKSEKSFQYRYGYSSLEDKSYPESIRYGHQPHEISQSSATFTMNALASSQIQTQQPLTAALYISIGGRFREITHQSSDT